jgi:hypothetical protein
MHPVGATLQATASANGHQSMNVVLGFMKHEARNVTPLQPLLVAGRQQLAMHWGASQSFQQLMPCNQRTAPWRVPQAAAWLTCSARTGPSARHGWTAPAAAASMFFWMLKKKNAATW